MLFLATLKVFLLPSMSPGYDSTWVIPIYAEDSKEAEQKLDSWVDKQKYILKTWGTDLRVDRKFIADTIT